MSQVYRFALQCESCSQMCMVMDRTYSEQETDNFFDPGSVLAEIRKTPGPTRDAIASFARQHNGHDIGTCFLRPIEDLS